MVPFSPSGSCTYGGPGKDHEIYRLPLLLRPIGLSLLPRVKGLFSFCLFDIYRGVVFIMFNLGITEDILIQRVSVRFFICVLYYFKNVFVSSFHIIIILSW